jgi:hypothetical protein
MAAEHLVEGAAIASSPAPRPAEVGAGVEHEPVDAERVAAPQLVEERLA